MIIRLFVVYLIMAIVFSGMMLAITSGLPAREKSWGLLVATIWPVSLVIVVAALLDPTKKGP